jgi:hypothetical protein
MGDQEPMLRAVEFPGPGIRVLRLGGDLDASAAGRRLAGLAGTQLRRVAADTADRPAHLLLDLASVRSLGPGGLDALVRIRDEGRAHGVRVHVTGLAARRPLVEGTRDPRHHLSSYPTVECALQELVQSPGRPSGRRIRIDRDT